jgi:hypothetical protein
MFAAWLIGDNTDVTTLKEPMPQFYCIVDQPVSFYFMNCYFF